MRILFDNVDFHSRRGPNLFGSKLASALKPRGHVVVSRAGRADVQLAFIERTLERCAPLVLRLDGIWLNTAMDWKAANAPIERTYREASAVVFQTEFNKVLVERHFGPAARWIVVRNGTDHRKIGAIAPMRLAGVRPRANVWCCASSWRPNKRLSENVRYFQEHAGARDLLLIAGPNPDLDLASVKDRRIRYLGDLDYEPLLSLYRASGTFLHLAWIDSCPNVVVDARAAGCKIICSSTGGTKEVAGPAATLIVEDEWDFQPYNLYQPPKLDFSRTAPNPYDVDIGIETCARGYESAFAIALAFPGCIRASPAVRLKSKDPDS